MTKPSDAADDAVRIDPQATVIVTRPAQDAQFLIDALRARGRTVLPLPVIAIRPVDDPSALARTMARITDYRLVVFVSPNAIRQALAHRSGAWPRDVTIGVMGPGSVATLAASGIAAPGNEVVAPAPSGGPGGIRNDRFDSEALFATLDATLGLSHDFEGRVLIVRGNGGRAWFADRLQSLGIAVDEVEAYRRVCPEVDAVASLALTRLFTARLPAVFVVTSSEGVGNLMSIVERAIARGAAASSQDVESWLFGMPIVASHRRIAETARRAGFSRVALCGPGDVGVLAAIE